jgi:hypothetical protein
VSAVDIHALGALPPFQPTQHRELPAHTQALDAGRFDQLFAQASTQNAGVELVNPARFAVQPGVDRAVSRISDLSGQYSTALTAARTEMKTLDMSDPKSIGKMMGHLTNVTTNSLQMSLIFTEVSSAKKSLEKLFNNQG